jgi:predicted ArsR family transcriptional regulator
MSKRCRTLHDLMRRSEGITVAEAAEILDCSAAAVRDAVRTIKEYGIPVSTEYAVVDGRATATYRAPDRETPAQGDLS